MDELKQYNRWIQYKLVQKDNGKLTKVPCNVAGYAIDPMLPENWQSWSSIQSKQRRGFVLADDGIACIDLDNCLTEPNKEQKKLYKVFSNSWVEKSVSGNGLHLWFKTDYTGNFIKHGLGIEIYTSGRFIALGTSVNNNQLQFMPGEELEKVLDNLGLVQPKRNNNVKTISTGGSDSVVDCSGITDADCQALLNKVLMGSYGNEHCKRVNGDISVDNGDWSLAVLRLCKALAFHSCRNVDLMHRTIKNCDKLLNQRSEERINHDWNNNAWLLEVCNYACR